MKIITEEKVRKAVALIRSARKEKLKGSEIVRTLRKAGHNFKEIILALESECHSFTANGELISDVSDKPRIRLINKKHARIEAFQRFASR